MIIASVYQMLHLFLVYFLVYQIHFYQLQLIIIFFWIYSGLATCVPDCCCSSIVWNNDCEYMLSILKQISCIESCCFNCSGLFEISSSELLRRDYSMVIFGDSISMIVNIIKSSISFLLNWLIDLITHMCFYFFLIYLFWLLSIHLDYINNNTHRICCNDDNSIQIKIPTVNVTIITKNVCLMRTSPNAFACDIYTHVQTRKTTESEWKILNKI